MNQHIETVNRLLEYLEEHEGEFYADETLRDLYMRLEDLKNFLIMQENMLN